MKFVIGILLVMFLLTVVADLKKKDRSAYFEGIARYHSAAGQGGLDP